MSDVRLPSSVEASAILRRTSANGDFAAIIRRGDADRGALTIVVASRGRHAACLQRTLDWSSGAYLWASVGPTADSGPDEIRDFLIQQARFDPDLWQIEVDVADPERFIAETSASG